ncbi:hypothetical protein OQ252_08750, partial [Acetobacter farinalis]
PSKPLFNIKETSLLHDPCPQSTQGKWNHRAALKTRGFFEPSTSFPAAIPPEEMTSTLPENRVVLLAMPPERISNPSPDSSITEEETTPLDTI